MQTWSPQILAPRVFYPYSERPHYFRFSRYFPPVFGTIQLVQHVIAHDQGWVIFWAILLLFNSLAIAVAAERPCRLVVTREGVLYMVGDALLYAPWEDMQRIAPHPTSRWRGSEGIFLRTARWQGRPFFPGRVPEGYIPLRSGRWPYWEQGAYEALGEGAPWLFESVPGQRR